MAVNIQKFLPPAKSYGNIEKYSRANNEISPVISENLSAITVKVIDVDKILKGTLASDKKQLDDKKKEDNFKKRQKAEEALEAKPDKKGGDKLSLPKLPKMGFLDWIKNFISNMILGFFAVRMIEHLPKLKGILSLIGSATDLAIDLGGKFLNGLVTFIDWGYKAYDATRGFLKNLGGENFTKVFDGFVNVIDDVIEAAIIASIAISSFRDEKEPDLGPGGKPGTGKTPLKTGKELYAEYDPKRSLIRKNYGDAAARIYDNEIANGKTPKQALANLKQRYISKGRIIPERALRLGEIRGSKVLGRGLAKAPQRAATKALVGAFGKGGAKTVLKFIRPFLKRIPIPVVGALIDFGLSVALDEKPGRAAFKAIGSGLAGIIGTAIGSIPPLVPFGGPFIGAALGGWAGDALGGALYDAFFENKKPKQQAKPKVQGRYEGGTIEELFAPKFTKGGFNSFNIPKTSFDTQSYPNVITSGLVKGQKGIDKIPTMLPEGAFVMSRGAVQKHGIRTLESMNSFTPSFGGRVVNQTKNIFSTANLNINQRETDVFGSMGSAFRSMPGPLGMLVEYLIGPKGGESITDKSFKLFTEGAANASNIPKTSFNTQYSSNILSPKGRRGVDKSPKMFAEGGLNTFDIPKTSLETQSFPNILGSGLTKYQRGFDDADKSPKMFAEGGLNTFSIPKTSFDTQSSPNILTSGLVKGQKGVDKIPTMLPEGAFVMSRGAVQKHGVNTLESMNASTSSFGGKVVNQAKSIFNTANSYINQRETNVFGPLRMLMNYLIGSKGGESIVEGIDKFPKMLAEGGEVTRGGKLQGPIQRTLEKGKYKREIAKKPGEVKIDSPGSEVGGKERILKLFPDPFESLSGKKDENPQEYVNPFNIVKSTGENLGKSDYFGPILSITAKYLLGQEPDQRDYKNVGLGINLLISKGIEEGKLKGGVAAAFAEGGSVDSETFSAVTKGGDITDWVAATFKKATETNAQKTLREIQENLKLKKPTGGGPGEQPPETSPDSLESGPAGSSGDALTMARNLMRDLGLTEAQSAGIVGNMIAESGVENARPQGSSPGTKGPLVVDGKTGYGIVQWTSKGRQQSLYNFAKSMGHDMSKPLPMNIEYKFFLKEFRENYGSVLEQIKKARDVKTASTIFMQQYEIPAGYKTQAKIMERYNLSQPLYQKLSSGQGTATDYAITDRIGPTLKGKFGLLSLGGTGAPGGDRTLGASSTFADTHKHHNKPDSDSHNQREFGRPRDYVITRGGQSNDRGAPVPAGVSGVAKVPGYGHNAVEIFSNSGQKVARFLHNDTVKVRDGQRVSPGTIIGTQGNKGTGVVHVHLETTPSNHTRWIQGIKRSAFHGENFGIVPKGGLRLNLHEGEMFKVVDKDSVDLLGFDLTKEIIDIENKAQLVARAPSIIEKLKTISGYASYEDQQTVVVIDDGPANVSYQGDSIGGVSGLSGYGIENATQDSANPMFESTYASR